MKIHGVIIAVIGCNTTLTTELAKVLAFEHDVDVIVAGERISGITIPPEPIMFTRQAILQINDISHLRDTPRKYFDKPKHNYKR